MSLTFMPAVRVFRYFKWWISHFTKRTAHESASDSHKARDFGTERKKRGCRRFSAGFLFCLLLITAALGALILYLRSLYNIYYTQSSSVVSALELPQALK